MTNINKKDSNNFLQVGRTIECGRCHPEKFEDCVSIQAKFGYKCNCICHDSPDNSVEWEDKIKNILLRNFDNDKYLWSVADKELKELITDTLASSRSQVLK